MAAHRFVAPVYIRWNHHVCSFPFRIHKLSMDEFVVGISIEFMCIKLWKRDAQNFHYKLRATQTKKKNETKNGSCAQAWTWQQPKWNLIWWIYHLMWSKNMNHSVLGEHRFGKKYNTWMRHTYWNASALLYQQVKWNWLRSVEWAMNIFCCLIIDQVTTHRRTHNSYRRLKTVFSFWKMCYDVKLLLRMQTHTHTHRMMHTFWEAILKQMTSLVINENTRTENSF